MIQLKVVPIAVEVERLPGGRATAERSPTIEFLTEENHDQESVSQPARAGQWDVGDRVTS